MLVHCLQKSRARRTIFLFARETMCVHLLCLADEVVIFVDILSSPQNSNDYFSCSCKLPRCVEALSEILQVSSSRCSYQLPKALSESLDACCLYAIGCLFSILPLVLRAPSAAPPLADPDDAAAASALLSSTSLLSSSLSSL